MQPIIMNQFTLEGPLRPIILTDFTLLSDKACKEYSVMSVFLKTSMGESKTPNIQLHQYSQYPKLHSPVL